MNKDELVLCTQRLRASVLLLEPKYARENMRVLCDCGRCTMCTPVACVEKSEVLKNKRIEKIEQCSTSPQSCHPRHHFESKGP